MENYSYITILIYSKFITLENIVKPIRVGFKAWGEYVGPQFIPTQQSEEDIIHDKLWDYVQIRGTCKDSLEENYIKNLQSYVVKFDPNAVIALIENTNYEKYLSLNILGYETEVSYTFDLQKEYTEQGGCFDCDYWRREFYADFVQLQILENAKEALYENCREIIDNYLESVHPLLCSANEYHVKNRARFRELIQRFSSRKA